MHNLSRKLGDKRAIDLYKRVVESTPTFKRKSREILWTLLENGSGVFGEVVIEEIASHIMKDMITPYKDLDTDEL